MFRLGVLCTFLAVALSAAPAHADFDGGMEAYANEEYDAAFIQLLPEAEKGIARAQCAVALMYHHGRGVGKDLTKAAEWYEKAARQNNVVALNNLGVMYRRGNGVARTSTRAIELFEKATLLGYGLSAYHLADMYRRGEGTDRDPLRAYVLYAFARDKLGSGRTAGKASIHMASLAQSLTTEEIKHADLLVEKLHAVAAEQSGAAG